MSNSAQKDNKPSAAKTEASKSQSAARMPPSGALPQMAPPPQLVALQRMMQGHVTTDPPVQRQEADGLSQGTITTSVIQREENENEAPEEVVPEQGAQEEQQVDTSSVTPEQKESAEQAVKYLRGMPAAEYAANLERVDDESLQLWLLKLRADDQDFMQIMMDTELGFELADKIIAKPLNFIPNYFALINYINFTHIPYLGGLCQGVTSVVHAAFSGILNLIPSLAGYFKAPDPFFAAAIRGRYHVAIVASQWTSEEMRNLWNSFKMVPRTHIVGKVTGLTRQKGIGSSYGGGTIKMATKLPQSITMGGAENLQRPFTKFLMKRSKYSNRMRSKNAFSMTTLHEVGHAVDAKLGLMTRYGRRPEFGGWLKNVSVDDIFMKYWDGVQRIGATNYTHETLAKRQAADQDKVRHDAFERNEGVYTTESRSKVNASFKAWQALNTEWREARNSEDDAHWEQQLGVPKSIYEKLGIFITNNTSIESKVNEYVPIESTMSKQQRAAANARRSRILAAINRLPPMRMVKHGKLREMTLGFGWNVDRATGANMAEEFGGKMFHEGYKNEWHGYDIAAKDDGVSHYQFRAPGEFFAELYAHYYMDTLTSKDKSQKHPLYDFVQKAVAENPECSLEVMTEGANQTIDRGPPQEQAADIPMANVVVGLESGNEQQVQEQAPLDQPSAPTNQEQPKDENSN